MLMLLAVPSCTGVGEAGPRVEVLFGAVEVSDETGGFRRVTGDTDLEEGSRVRTGPDSAALIRLSGPTMELGEETAVSLSEGLRLDRGSVLAQGGLTIGVVEADVATAGAVRLDRGLSLRIGAYEGQARVTGPSGSADVQRWRESTLAQGVTPRQTRPLRVAAQDRWDRRMLSDQLELQRWIDAFLAGLGEGSSMAVAVRAQMRTPPVPATLLAVGLSDADLLVATALAAASPGLFAENAGTAVRLRAELAQWAVVAAVLGADDDQVRRLLSAGLDRPPTPTPGPTLAPAPGPRSSPDRTPRPPGPTLTPGPAPTPPPDPCPDCNPVERLLCSLLGTCSRLPLP